MVIDLITYLEMHLPVSAVFLRKGTGIFQSELVVLKEMNSTAKCYFTIFNILFQIKCAAWNTNVECM